MAPARYAGPEFEDFYGDEYMARAAAPDSGSRTLAQMAGVLWRHKFRILAAMAVCGALAYMVSFALTPRFMSTGIIAIQTRPIYLQQLGMAQPPQQLDPSIPRSEAQILTSRSLLESVAKQLHLDEDPDLNPYLEDPSLFARITGAARDSARKFMMWTGLAPKPDAADEADEGDAVWAAVIDNMKKRLGVHTDGKSYVIYASYDGTHPRVSSDVVNTLMKNFLMAQIESSSKALLEANAWIKQRADELRGEVQEADKQVQAYRSKYNLVDTKMGGTVSEQQLSDLNTALSKARADRAEAEAKFSDAQGEARNARGNDATSAFEVLNSELIQRLREREAEAFQRRAEMSSRLGPNHPQIKSVNAEIATLQGSLQREIGKILRSLQNQVTIARTREETLVRQINTLQARATETAAYQVDLDALVKEADTKRQVYQTFLATAQQTADPTKINQTNARIVSSAVPPVEPTSPKRSLFALGGVFLGFLVASAAVLLLSELDRGFENASDVEGTLGVPVLGTLPFIRNRAQRRYGLGQELIDGPHSPVAETLRGIRVALRSQAERGISQVVLVTSAQPGEGKTSFASAMAAIAARDGLRVLVVDSDLRRPRFHRMFRTEPGPALQDVLRGSRDWAEAVRADPDTGAHCLTAHERTDSPVSLLSSGHWESFLTEARKTYDLIILDSPPVIQVADALTLADYVDATVFVVAYRSTHRRVIEEAIHRFETTNKPITGVVMSKVPASMVAQSYYAGYAAA
ncbi:MAG TPA: polysaccharide biosynthesis tyrosine autokinase [Alphaproteobacteria bacterium]|jgi:capsular exopolysaccharide synthesis family protein|nr:polysaccharide biosynthesis tyrosine autokinase [Alphaproteobacteria bacterium]